MLIGLALLFVGFITLATINDPSQDAAITVLFAAVVAVVVAGVLRWHADLFSDHVALGPWFGQERVIALDRIDEAFIETRGSGDDRSRELYLKVEGREIAVHASRLSGRQRELFAAALSRAVLVRRLAQSDC
jgi:hypothetical protein